MKKKIITVSLISLILTFAIILLLQITTKNTYAVSVGDTLVEYVKNESLGNSYVQNTGDGVYLTNGNEYRYVGAEPNNYVWFNNDMYRIIGVFDENSHGVKDENDNGVELVKLIRSRILNSTTWGTHNKNATGASYSGYTSNWTGNTTTTKTNLNILLNHFFLEDTTNNYGTCYDWTYYSNNQAYKTNNCSDILNYGIKENSGLQDYIETVTWYLKGYSSNAYSKQDFYLCERGQSEDTVNCGNGGTSGEYDSSTQEKIGLMYASDYLYASGYIASDATTTVSSTYHFGIKNWLLNSYEWTITAQANNAEYVYATEYDSKLVLKKTTSSFMYRPTFYLKSSVYVTGGDGSFDNPYTIACDDCSD